MNRQKEGRLPISVVIPVRNGERTILACLESLAAQSFPPDEIIVIENGSTDQTVSRVKQWVLTQPDLHPRLVTETRKGPSAARNRGAKAAKGKTLAFIDADCIAPREWLKKISEEIRQGIDAVGGPYQGPSLPDVEKYAAMSWFFGNPDPTFSFSHPFLSRFLLGGNMALLRDAFQRIGGFDETLHTGEDLDISFRLEKAGFTLKVLPHLAVTHQIDSS
ncbi:glycosyltransferase, partial [candidate division TA06 bacterium]|nr:glycosyltransferase [candidate division TA06 bacterium]